jgi:tetratricopeptide (TPR) repeat protein
MTDRAVRRRRAGPRAEEERAARSLRERLPVEKLTDVFLLAVLATVLYANAFSVPLILDNQVVIAQDPRIRAVRTENLSSILTQDYMAGRSIVSGVYRPITTLSYLANYAVLGNETRPAGYHAVNLLLHVANAALVYLLAGLLLGTRTKALCTAALFVAHPIATEAVTNVVGRADLLAASAVLAGTLAYVRSTRETGRERRRWLIALGCAALFGLLAKENAIALLGVMLVYDLTHRAPGGGLRRPGEILRSGYAAVLPALVLVGLVRWRVYAGTVPQRPSFIDNPLVGADFWSARLTAVKVLGRSVALLVWPRTLSWDYSYDQIPLVRWPFEGWEDWQAPIVLVAAIAAIVVALRSRRRQPAFCFFLLFGVVTALPTSNLLVPIGTIMAERFLYLPVVGFAACLVLGLAAVAERLRRPIAPTLIATVVAIVVAAYGVRTIARNVDWRDEMRLTQSGLESAPRSAKAYIAYASALSHQEGLGGEDVESLVAHSEAALAIMDERPLPPEMQESNIPLLLGIFYKTKGQRLANRGDDGRPWYERAAAMLDRATDIQRAQSAEYRRAALDRGLREDQIAELGGYELAYHLGDVHMLLGEPAKAAEDFARLRRLAPLAPETHLSVARAAMATGDVERAVRSLTLAYTLGRRDAETQRLLVDAYGRLDPRGCAVKRQDDRTELDGTCPLVRTHLCAAYEELIELSIDTRQWNLGRRVGEAAIKTGDCDPAPFERLLARVKEQAR